MRAAQFFQIEAVGLQTAQDISSAHAHDTMSMPAFMDYTLFCRLVDDLPVTAALHLCGMADPFLHLHFFRMARYAAARGMRVTAGTSLSTLPPYRADECIQSGLHVIQIALNAATPATYEAIHGKPRFEKTLRNLRRLIQARQAFGGVRPEVHLTCRLNRRNLHELPDLVWLAHAEGVDRLLLHHAWPAEDNHGCWPPELYSAGPAYGISGNEDYLQQADARRVDLYLRRAHDVARMLCFNLRLSGPAWQGAAAHRLCYGSLIRHDGRRMSYSMPAEHLPSAEPVESGAQTWDEMPSYSYHSWRPLQGAVEAREAGHARLP